MADTLCSSPPLSTTILVRLKFDVSKKKAAKRSRRGIVATSLKSAMAEASLDLQNGVNLAMSFGLMASELVIACSSCSCARFFEFDGVYWVQIFLGLITLEIGLLIELEAAEFDHEWMG
nr:hypothetical protein CFP56_23261 [Quercus suber]